MPEVGLVRGRRIAGLIAIATLALAGCSASAVPSGAGATPLGDVSIDGYDNVTAQLDYDHAIVVTPVSQFSLSNSDYMIRLLHAIAVRADSCMEKAGFPATAGQHDWSPFLAEEDRSYGLWSVAYASKYGVDLAAEAGPEPVDVIDMGVEQGKKYAECSDVARESLDEELLWSQGMNIDSEIRGKAYDLVVASDAGKAAKADWAACMEAQGIVLDPTTGWPVQQYEQQGKEAEIAASVVEAECARSTGAVQTLYDLQARYEAALIDAQSARVKEFKTRRAEVIGVFEDAIAGG